jgi:penicillin-binding protein 2
MDDKTDQRKVFTRRTFILAGGKALLGTALVSRLYYLGVMQSSHYKTLANGNRIRLEILVPPRGRILDRFGNIFASNDSSYQLVVTPFLMEDRALTLKKIDALIHLGDEKIDSILKEIKKRPKFNSFSIVDSLTWDEVCKLEVHASELPGVAIKEGACRFYPDGESTPHFIGYVQIPTEEDRNDSPLYKTPQFRLGKSGIEKHFDETLCGKPGYKEIEVNAHGKFVRELATHSNTKGKDVSLTIDYDLQRFVHERLSQEQSASASVVDLSNGHILALSSVPTFNPNLFTNGIRQDEWNSLLTNPYGILNDKTVKGLYSPGSIYKIIFALAALEYNTFPANFESYCTGHIDVGNHRFHCWKKEGHGAMTLETALQSSCDVYFYNLARYVKLEHLVAVSRKFGLGQATGIELPLEKEGLLPSKEWKLRKTGVKWHKGDTILLSIGQGSLLVTPLQMTMLMAKFATNNLNLRPRLITKVDDQSQVNPTLPLQPACHPRHLERIKKGLFGAVNEPGGTAYGSRILEPGLEMAGKTSTTQVRRITMQERKTHVPKNHELPWHERTHAMFAGYAPAHNPRFSIFVLVEHGGGGGKVAAPIAKDIMIEVQKKGYV